MDVLKKLGDFLGEQEYEEGLRDRIIAFFKENPDPDDDLVHDFADELGIEHDELEKEIYAMLSSFINEEKDEPFGEDEMPVDVRDIESETIENEDFRRVLYTGKHLQLTLMAIEPDGEIGEEVHNDTDQFFRFEEGEGMVIVNRTDNYPVKDGSTVIIKQGTYHNVINTSSTETLKLYSLYAPPHHLKGTVHPTKADAMADEAEASESTRMNEYVAPENRRYDTDICPDCGTKAKQGARFPTGTVGYKCHNCGKKWAKRKA